ncbi:class II aldolase/adducin family protein [Methylophilus luteus]|jgi:L-ribulose-5-phosphate 4-epimerase|uniref:Class II aldolase/adducin family protein n=1 Tax=Methylophilus luteus TaxID=640108 RepID=A0ABW3F4C5_9PROT
MSDTFTEAELVKYVEQAKADALHSFNFLKETGTLSATWTYHITHKIPGQDKLLNIRFPWPWERSRDPVVSIDTFSEKKDHILQESRIDADTVIHAHTPYLAAWSLAQINFPILYVAAQRHLLAREIPNHLDRTRSILSIIAERLDNHPELAPPPALLESNGGANIWGKGIIGTSQLVLLIEEAARFQSLAEQVGGAKDYTPGALEVQWKRTGLVEKAKQYTGRFIADLLKTEDKQKAA